VLKFNDRSPTTRTRYHMNDLSMDSDVTFTITRASGAVVTAGGRVVMNPKTGEAFMEVEGTRVYRGDNVTFDPVPVMSFRVGSDA
jgi:hypothetical protein